MEDTTFEIEFNEALRVGEVAVAFSEEGARIIHRIEKIEETGEIVGAENGAGFIQALACMLMMYSPSGDSTRYIKEACRLLEEGKLGFAPKTVN